MQSYEFGLYVFMLAAFLGFELVKRVSPLLHTPLMSLSNAISAIAVVGGILVTGDKDATELTRWLGDESLRRGASERARKFVFEQYDRRKIAARWIEHYRELTGAPAT